MELILRRGMSEMKKLELAKKRSQEVLSHE